MGNVAGKEELENGDDPSVRSDGDGGLPPYSNHVRRANSADSMGSTTLEGPGRSRSPLMFSPQIPVPPLLRATDSPPVFNQLWVNEAQEPWDGPLEMGIPTMISWNLGGNDVLVEGSWDNWTTRKALQRSGKVHSILLVLPSGVYQYKFIVDGERRYIPDLPCITDEMGQITNLLDVHDYVPENPESVAEFDSPSSPDSSYSWSSPSDEDFAKEPPAVPPQLHLTVLGMQHSEEAYLRPQHVVLNHLFIEKECASQSLVSLGLTHRFQSKYVTVVLYKPVRR
ncbi:SNF1-related protein kinase regulatory subunit beta-1-like [Phoenix dactylifera]|uniref:SNF1-related protein kinase regulatory subunit beta-1-like n=1 Tax=Phoenix dactylifera TaxID=42345 RepID=A0A8B7D1G0_PHODC|nr:SNF1-related protein kinase regulatory subunit beta-1-like [Phoenix dactylifera]